jgi:hypothetical protein
MWKILRRLLIGFGIVLGIFILFVGWVYWQISSQKITPIVNNPDEYEKKLIAQLPDTNGVKYYLQGMLAFDTMSFQMRPGETPKNSPVKFIDGILDNVWKEDNPRVVEILDKNEKAIEFVREGAKKDFAEFPKVEKRDFSSPVPNFLTVLQLSKVLIVQGKQYESKKEYPHAEENYLSAIKFGQSFGGENAVLISKLISIRAETLGYNALRDFLKNNPKQSEKFYSDLIAQLEAIHKNEKSIKYTYTTEFQAFHNTMEKTPRTGMLMTASPKNNWLVTLIGVYFFFRKGTVLKDMDDFNKEFMASLDKPYAEIKDIDWMRRISKMDIISRISAPNYTHSFIRHFVLEDQSGLTELGTAIQLYQSQKSHLPESLDDLSPGILKEMPKDPFTDKSFVYYKTDDGFKLYGLGPDLNDDKGALIYDPTKGTTSAGDIVY